MQDTHRVVVVLNNPKRNPYELWVLAALFISGLIMLLGVSPRPDSLQSSLPQISRVLWNLIMVIGSGVAIIGNFIKKPTYSLSAQIFGHLWTASGTFLYGGLVFYYVGLRALLPGILILGACVAAITKVLQLRRQLRSLVKRVGENHVADVFCAGSGGS